MTGFTRKELKVFFSVVLALLLVSLTVTISVSLSRRRKADREAAVWKAEEKGVFSFNDFLVPEEYTQPWYLGWKPFREPMERWDEETADRFSVDISAVVLQVVRDANTARLTGEK